MKPSNVASRLSFESSFVFLVPLWLRNAWRIDVAAMAVRGPSHLWEPGLLSVAQFREEFYTSLQYGGMIFQ